MTSRFKPRNGWGPDRQRAALSISFDNFGEAAEIQDGRWGNREVGRHLTAAFLPRLLAVLGDLRVTYFIEAINTQLYPDELRSWRAAGHEVGVHGWRHEAWSKCNAPDRMQLLVKSINAMNALGLEPRGFRPPGGKVPEDGWQQFNEQGLLYCSDLSGIGISTHRTVVSIPFVWQNVDAFMLEDALAPVRVREGASERIANVNEWSDMLHATVDAVLRDGSHQTLIFHPNLLAKDSAKLAGLTSLLERLRVNPNVWIAPMFKLADFVGQEVRAYAGARSR